MYIMEDDDTEDVEDPYLFRVVAAIQCDTVDRKHRFLSVKCDGTDIK